MQTIDIAKAANPGAPGLELPVIKRGRLADGNQHFEVQGPVIVGVQGESKTLLPLQSVPIPIGADVSSILFLHATAKAAANDMSYRYIHNFPDTADLLGWYEVFYEDGFVESVPVRFGWNILPVTWGKHSDVVAKGNAKELSYAYAADAIPCGDATLFAYEWVNPRFGKVVTEVRLRGTTGFLNTKAKPVSDNAIVLAGISVVKKRSAPPAQ
jgi:hypothetical protein